MNRSTHIDLTKTVALAVGWPGDVNTLARSAALPDEVLTVRVKGAGHHFLGHNLASLCHFCVPYGDGFRGYNYKMDGSLPGWNLPDAEVFASNSGWHLNQACQDGPDPLDELLHNKKIRHSADELTFPSAAIMAQWLAIEFKYHNGYNKTRDYIAGMICHFVQDCCVPHHARGVLASGHRSFEGKLDDEWPHFKEGREWKINDKIAMPKSIREICEREAAIARNNDINMCFRNAAGATGEALLLLMGQSKE